MLDKTVDQFSDPSFRVLAARIREVPEFEPLIKTAALDQGEVDSLPNTAFAWSDRRMFPLHTPEQAALSYLYATAKTASVPAEVIDSLTNALDLYGVIVPDTRKKTASFVEADLGDFLLPDRRRWHVTSPEAVKLAEEALRAHKHDLSVEERMEAAYRLVKKAEVYGVKLASDTFQTAGMTYSDLDTVRHWVEARADHAPEGVAQGYMKLANELSRVQGVSDDREALLKLAAVIDSLDKQAGFDTDPHTRFYDAITTTFNSLKLAEPMVDLAGKSYALSKLAAIPESVYSDVFGADVAAELKTAGALDTTKLSEVLPTMPRDLLSTFARSMRGFI